LQVRVRQPFTPVLTLKPTSIFYYLIDLQKSSSIKQAYYRSWSSQKPRLLCSGSLDFESLEIKKAKKFSWQWH
jgi:hypothetical protein